MIGVDFGADCGAPVGVSNRGMRAPMLAPDTVLAGRCARYLGVEVEDLRGPCRLRRLALARWAIWTVLRTRDWSLPHMAGAFGRDHATAIHGLRRASALRAGWWLTTRVCVPLAEWPAPDWHAAHTLLLELDAVCADLARGPLPIWRGQG
jgi:hypothetical protein